jgi:radical SAM protein with 4Fe4S-binding SPASM domain
VRAARRRARRVVDVELTDACNNRCLHCYNPWRHSSTARPGPARRPLTPAAIADVLKRIDREVGLTSVALTGGEPTLRSDFPAILAALTDAGFQTIVITNGTRLTPSLLRRLPSGLTFEVTLFSHRARVHDALAGRPVFEEVTSNILALERHGSSCVVAFVATAQNALDVYRTAELALALGAAGFMYNRVNVGAGMRGREQSLVPPAETLRNSLLLVQEAVRNLRFPVACSIPVPPCVVDHAPFADLRFNWCPRGGPDAYYTVGSTGLLRPCNHSSLVIGDILKSGFRELVESAPVREFWAAEPAECAGCVHPLKERCAGGCRAAAAEYYGTPNRWDPLCELAGRPAAT